MQTSTLARHLLALLFTFILVPVFAAPIDEGRATDADAQTKALIERRLSQEDLARFHRVEVSVTDGVV